jgi:hypothetical protein
MIFPAGVGGRALDRLVGGPIGIRRLQKPQRLLRLLEIVLGGELVEVVPQADHLRRLARRQQLDSGEFDGLAARLRPGKHLAGMDRDGIAFQRTEAGCAILLKTDPF